MKTEHKARIAAVALLGVALAMVLVREGRRQRAPETVPQDAVYRMLDAARAGDVRTYLSCYSGPMRSALRQSAAEAGEPGFGKYLRDSNAAVKGIAVAEPQPMSDREVKLRVEYVYQDRNEAQTMYLERNGTVWTIARVDGVERVKTLVPYGTPVR